MQVSCFFLSGQIELKDRPARFFIYHKQVLTKKKKEFFCQKTFFETIVVKAQIEAHVDGGGPHGCGLRMRYLKRCNACDFCGAVYTCDILEPLTLTIFLRLQYLQRLFNLRGGLHWRFSDSIYACDLYGVIQTSFRFVLILERHPFVSKVIY